MIKSYRKYLTTLLTLAFLVLIFRNAKANLLSVGENLLPPPAIDQSSEKNNQTATSILKLASKDKGCTNYLIGNAEILPNQKSSEAKRFSFQYPHGFDYETTDVEITSSLTGETVHVQDQKQLQFVSASDDLTKVYFVFDPPGNTDEPLPIYLYDSDQEQMSEIPLKRDPKNDRTLRLLSSTDGNIFTVIDFDMIEVYFTTNKAVKKISLPVQINNEEATKIELSHTGRWLYYLTNNNPHLIDLYSGEELIIENLQLRKEGIIQWSENDAFFIYSTGDSSLAVANPYTHKSVIIRSETRIIDPFIVQNAGIIVFYSQNKLQAYLLNGQKLKEFHFDNPITEISPYSFGNKIVFKARTSGDSHKSNYYTFFVEKWLANSTVELNPVPDFFNWKFSQKLITKDETFYFDAYTLENNTWSFKASIDSVCLSPASESASVLDQQNQDFLNKFEEESSEDSIQFESYLPTLLQYLNIHKENPDNLKKIFPQLLVLFSKSNLLYMQLLEQFPGLQNLKFEKQDYERFQDEFSSEQLEQFKNTATVFVKTLAMMTTNLIESEKSTFYWNRYLTPLQPILTSLDPDEKEHLIDGFGILLTNHFVLSSQYHSIAFSKVANFIIERMKPYFGLKKRHLTDLTLIQANRTLDEESGSDEIDKSENSNDEIEKNVVRGSEELQANERTASHEEMVPIIISVDPIDNDIHTYSPYGFYLKVQSSLFINRREITDKKMSYEVKWNTNHETFTGTAQIQNYVLNNVIPSEPGPRYDQLWQDQKLQGLIIIGSNMRGDTATLVNQYLIYLRDQDFDLGFELPEIPLIQNNQSITQKLRWKPSSIREIKDTKNWIAGKIMSGELDYMMKESHTGGEDQNLIRVDKESLLIKATKKKSDNGGVKSREEVVYLVFPKLTKAEAFPLSDMITNVEFGHWIRIRDFATHSQFVYINSSCESYQKAINEIIASRSSLLLDIPTIDNLFSFTNKPDNASRILWTGLRNENSFAQLKMELNNIKKSGQVANPFIFPLDPVYHERITSNLENALDVQIEVKNQSGEQIHNDRD